MTLPRRHQQEEDLRENHPYFDTPLFAMGRDSRFRLLCTVIVNARYKYNDSENLVTGSTKGLGKSKYKQLQFSPTFIHYYLLSLYVINLLLSFILYFFILILLILSSYFIILIYLFL